MKKDGWIARVLRRIANAEIYLRCHNCFFRVRWNATQCPICNEPLTVGAILRRWLRQGVEFCWIRWWRFWGGRQFVFCMACPRCGHAVHFSETYCANCQLSADVSGLKDWYWPRLKWWWRQSVKDPVVAIVGPVFFFVQQRSRLQMLLVELTYLLISLLLLALAVLYIENRFAGRAGAFGAAILTGALYTALLAFVVRWVAGVPLLSSLRRPSRRLMLVMNYVTFMLFFLALLDAWPYRAWIILSTFGVMLSACWLFTRLLCPVWQNFYDVYTGAEQSTGYYRGRGIGGMYGHWGSRMP